MSPYYMQGAVFVTGGISETVFALTKFSVHIPCVSWVGGRFFTNTATWEAPDDVTDQ